MPIPTFKLQLAVSHAAIRRNLEGISHEESLVHPDPGGNCINWVLGHIVRGRNRIVTALSGNPLFPREEFDAYSGDAPQPLDPARATPLHILQERLDDLQRALLTQLDRLDERALSEPAPFSPGDNPGETVGSLLAVIALHDGYHAGQLGVLRRMIGKPGAIQDAERAGSE